MTTTRLAFDGCATRWAAVSLCCAAGFAVACGSSATTLGISAATGGVSGARSDGGASNGGASNGGTSNGGASNGGGGGATPCIKDLDCTNNSICVYLIADACNAQGSCQARPPKGPVCSTIYCGCPLGVTPPADVNVNCEVAAGYARAPVKAPKGSAGCP